MILMLHTGSKGGRKAVVQAEELFCLCVGSCVCLVRGQWEDEREKLMARSVSQMMVSL